ncbi:hypothetical protein EAE96_007523 [Botrytis aclada]|nr:hypothetical protein EAE96_007523 [Botrytis aclada]
MIDCPTPVAGSKRNRADFEEDEQQQQPNPNLQIPPHRRRGATVLMRVNASLLTIRIQFLDKNSKSIPEDCVILKAPIENSFSSS